ncbi:ead/Ea22-like family protein [Escherichia coli]|uniref:ead/Ea22-like family protein n=1 Tax=Escherichia coli TaxID=562 RepID=UPI003989B770
MSKIDYQALRAKAEKATCGEWSLEYGKGRFDSDDALIHREVAGYIPICRIEGAHPESGFDEDFQMEQQANAEFIAAANPATVLTLLDELETAKKRIAELEAEPVRQTYKLPQTQFEQVADLYEMQFDDGRTCAFHTDVQKAAQWLQTCDGNRVQEYVKLERLQNALSGNSPVTQDGWISCSERMPEIRQTVIGWNGYAVRQCVYTRNEYAKTQKGREPRFEILTGIWHGVTHWMPLPEPPQEAKRWM